MQCGCIAIETFPCDNCGEPIKNASRYLLFGQDEQKKRICVKCGLEKGLAYLMGEQKATSFVTCGHCNTKIRSGSRYIPGIPARLAEDKSKKIELCMNCALDKEYLDKFPGTTVSFLPRLPIQKQGTA